ncbi:MAG: acetyl-CoA carboxylase biotin carboxyl carrier protein [Solobacterium sp.]|nr:acetyl-CoA carboxylase biotin carboxyl carrier protein [Solobacterium sp.]
MQTDSGKAEEALPCRIRRQHMDLEKIEALIKLLEDSSLQKMKVKDGDFEISLSRFDQEQPVTVTQASAEPEEEDEVNITSPIVGTFYSASGPTIPAYVRTGDRVRAGDVICILEAMKMMNEITAEFDCEILAVLVSNEQKVEYGQPLFRVRKL